MLAEDHEDILREILWRITGEVQGGTSSGLSSLSHNKPDGIPKKMLVSIASEFSPRISVHIRPVISPRKVGFSECVRVLFFHVCVTIEASIFLSYL